jgi:hypothetical protein
MFEDFRKQAEQADFPDDDQDDDRLENRYGGGHFLGMNPVQRFVVAMMLLFMTIIVGTLFLVVTSKVALPGLG